MPVVPRDQSLLEKYLCCSLRSAQQFSQRYLPTATPVPLWLSVFTPAHVPCVFWKTQAHRQSRAAPPKLTPPSSYRSFPGALGGPAPPLGGAEDLVISRPGDSPMSSFISLGLEIEHRESHLALASHRGESLFSIPPLTLEKLWPVFSCAWKPDLERLIPPLEEVDPLKIFLTLLHQHLSAACPEPHHCFTRQLSSRVSFTSERDRVPSSSYGRRAFLPLRFRGSLHSFPHGPSSFCGPSGTMGRGPSPFLPRPWLALGMRKAGSWNAESWNSGNSPGTCVWNAQTRVLQYQLPAATPAHLSACRHTHIHAYMWG